MLRFPRCLVLTLLSALAMLSVSACGTASSSPSPTASLDSGVQGRAMITGGPAPGSPRPNAGVAVAVHQGDLGGRVVTEVTADSSGAFAVDLPPGRYTLIEVTGFGATPKTLSVQPGSYVKATLWVHVP